MGSTKKFMKKHTVFLLSPAGLDPRELKASVEDLLAEMPEAALDALLDSAEHLSEQDVESMAAEVVVRPTAFGVLNPEEPFVWRTHKGEEMAPSEMATQHIFYSLRMLWNHTAPPVFRVTDHCGFFKRYRDVPHWTPEYKIEAMHQLTSELEARELSTDPDDRLDPEMRDQFADIVANAKLLALITQAKPLVERKSPAPFEAAPFVVKAPAVRRKRSAKKRTAKAKKPSKKSAKRSANGNRVRGYVRANGNRVRGYRR